MFRLRLLPPAVQSAFHWDNRAGLFVGLFSGLTIPFFGVIARRDLHASAFEISLLISAPFVGHLISMFVACHMQDRPKKPYVVWVGVASRTLLLLMAFATTSPLFISLIILSQIIGCFSSPAYSYMMKVIYPDRYRGQLMGLIRVGLTLVSMTAGLSAGQLMDHGLPRYWVMAIAGVAAFFVALELQRNVQRVVVAAALLLIAYLCAPFLAGPVSYRIIFPIAALFGITSSLLFNQLKETREDNICDRRFNVLEGLGTLVKDKKFGLYSLAFFTFGFGNLLQSPLVPLFQVDELHINYQWVGYLAMASAGISALFYWIWGRMLDRYSPFLTVILSFAISGLSPLVYANAHSLPTLLIAALLAGIGGPGVDLTWLNAVLDFTDNEGIPRYSALHTFLVGIRGFIAPFVGVWLLDHLSLRGCFYVSAGIIWTGTIAMALIVWFVIFPASRRRFTRPRARVQTSA